MVKFEGGGATLGSRGDAVALPAAVGAPLYPIVYLFRLYAHGCVVWFNYCCISLFSKKSSETANVLPDHYTVSMQILALELSHFNFFCPVTGQQISGSETYQASPAQVGLWLGGLLECGKLRTPIVSEAPISLTSTTTTRACFTTNERYNHDARGVHSTRIMMGVLIGAPG